MADGLSRLPSGAANQMSLSGEKAAATSANQVAPGLGSPLPEEEEDLQDPIARSKALQRINERSRDVKAKMTDLALENPRGFAGLVGDIQAIAPTVSPSTGAEFTPANPNIRSERQAHADVLDQMQDFQETGDFSSLLTWTDAELAENKRIKEAIDAYESKESGANLTAIGGLIDDLFGTDVLKNYEAPISDAERQANVFDMKTKAAEREARLAESKIDGYREILKWNKDQEIKDKRLQLDVGKAAVDAAAKTNDASLNQAQLEFNKLKEELNALEEERNFIFSNQKLAQDAEVASENRASKENIAALNRESAEKISTQRTAAQRDIATEKAETQKEIAQLKKGATKPGELTKEQRDRFVVAADEVVDNKERAKAANKFLDDYLPLQKNLIDLMEIMESASRIELAPDKITRAQALSAQILVKLKQTEGLGVLSAQDFKFLEDQVPGMPVGRDIFRNNLTKVRNMIGISQRDGSIKLQNFGVSEGKADEISFGKDFEERAMNKAIPVSIRRGLLEASLRKKEREEKGAK